MQNIFIVGPMGSGKTTIGRQLASRTNMHFYDSDREIEKSTGVDIALIFEIEGEDGFRLRETKMLEKLTSMKGILLATGGGSVVSEVNRARLKKRGKVIYLKSSAEKIFDRTVRDKKRPLLNTDDRMSRITELLEQREPLYEEVADLIIYTENNSIRGIVNKICQQMNLT